MFTFSKHERLCNKETIAQLYASPLRTLAFPLSVHWKYTDPSNSKQRLQVVIVAPKKKLHHAVDRNRTKRIVRECYRTRKPRLLAALESENKALVISINYILDKTPDFHKTEAVMDRIINEIVSDIKKSNT